MNALCVDDERILLEVLKRAVEASPDVDYVAAFSNATDAIAWAEKNPVDIAFLDIQIHQTNGLDLARKLMEKRPKLPVIFCTGYSNYALDAFRIHAAGYLTKPIYKEDVQEIIDRIIEIYWPLEKKPSVLQVQCFGNFEVYHEGKPLEFKRKKSKELMAYLIDRKGAFASQGQISAVLWNEETGIQKQKNYFYQVLHHLKEILKKAGFPDAVISGVDGYAIDKKYIDCDYYRFLDGEEDMIRGFHGEYMYQYSWAEETCGLLELK